MTHPNIWNLIDALKVEENLCRLKMAHLIRGDNSEQKKKYKENNTRIGNLVNSYDKDKKLEFLNNMGNIIKYV